MTISERAVRVLPMRLQWHKKGRSLSGNIKGATNPTQRETSTVQPSHTNVRGIIAWVVDKRKSPWSELLSTDSMANDPSSPFHTNHVWRGLIVRACRHADVTLKSYHLRQLDLQATLHQSRCLGEHDRIVHHPLQTSSNPM